MILIEKANNLPKTFTETIPMYRKTATETLRMECFKYGAGNHATLSAKVLNSGVYWALVEFEIPEGMLTGEWVVKFYDYTGMVSETLMRIVFEQQTLMEYDIHSDLKEYDRGEHYNLDYLRFEFEEDDATLFAKASAGDRLQFSFDKEHWFDYLEPSGSNIIVNGRVIYFRGLRTDFQRHDLNFRSETRHDIYGDIRTLTNFVLLDNDTAPRIDYLFVDNTGLINFYAKLPYKKLTDFCYQAMFYRCTSLTTAPELPATELATSCYQAMFNGCTSLTEVPALPATELKQNCYQTMFNGCTSLTEVPALPATELASSCYQSMFQRCTSLTTAPKELPATELANSCYSQMFYGCTSLTAAPELSATTLAVGCCSSMFSGCTSLTAAPELPATTLERNCYYQMFYNCKSLTASPELPATELVNSCYYQMFYGCAKLKKVTTYANNISTSGCLTYWLSGVSSTGEFYNHGTATYQRSVSGIPTRWTEIKE